MNKIIGFIKANLVVVVSVVLILAVLPVGYIFSAKWNTQVHEKANAAYNKEKRTLTTKGTINYSLPAVLEGEQDLSETRAPNSAVTKFYKDHKAQREQQVQEVVERGTAFNQGDHVELVEGILPLAPNDLTLKRLGREMAEAIVGTNTTSSVYQRKLQRLNAGSPPNPESLSATLTDFQTREQQRYESSNADGKVTPAQTEQLDKDLIARRLGEYIGRSGELTFYCSPDAFVSDGKSRSAKGEFSQVPASVPPLSTIDEAVVFNWLWDYWVISDVLEAAALANQNPVSGAMAIPDAPIKSIERISISKIDLGDGSDSITDEPTSGGGGGRGRGGSSTSSTEKKDETVGTFTGRAGGEANGAYDIRMVTVVVVAASKDLPKFIDAIGKTNYMTVTDLDLEQVNIWGDLELGYYYGNDHVVRATITIESVWLRSWMMPMMPDQIKVAMGIPVEDENNPEDDG